jgi:hypothetical protein
MDKKSTIKEIEELYELLQSGHISKEEYQELKSRLITNLVPKKESKVVDIEVSTSKTVKTITTKPSQSNTDYPKKKKSKSTRILWLLSVIAIIVIGLLIIPTPIKSLLSKTTEHIEESVLESELIIEGENIWIRDEPSTGEVVMKLNTGDRCKLLMKGDFEEIRGMYDYWYKVEYNGKLGWVYGSQSNLKTGYSYSDAIGKGLVKNKEEPRAPSSPLNDFFEKYTSKSNSVDNFIHPSAGVLVLNNSGVMCWGNTKSSVWLNDIEIPSSNVFNGIPQGDHCEGYSGSRDGFYNEKVSQSDLPHYTQDGENITKLSIPNSIIPDEIIKVCLIKSEDWVADFYFIKANEMLYLICQDFCDCSG